MKNSTFADRLNLAMKVRGFTQASLADAVGMAQPSVWKLTSGLAKSSKKSVQIASALNINPQWLVSGDGEMSPDPDFAEAINNPKSDLRNTRLKVKVVDDDETPDLDEYVEVPLLDITLSAGDGSYEITDYSEFSLIFRRYYLKKLGISESSARLVRVTGNSMEPTLYDGDIVGVNVQDTAIRDGKTYAIRQGDLLRVKILIERPEHVVIRSINRDEYEDEVMPREAFYRDVRVIGKVFWSSHDW